MGLAKTSFFRPEERRTFVRQHCCPVNAFINNEEINMVSPDLKPELAFIYMTHKGLVRDKYKNDNKLWSTSPEDDFWIYYIVLTFDTTWDNKSKVEINLSDLLRLYLRIYREDVKPEMTAEEEPAFLELLKERFYKARKAFDPPVDTRWLKSHPAWRLGQIALGKDSTAVDKDTPIIKQTGISHAMVSVMNSLDIPFKLVKDV